jgi:hypothetical protein
MSVAIVSAASIFAKVDQHNDDNIDLDAFQSIPGQNIDFSKLLSLLRMKFGAGSYNMHVSCYLFSILIKKADKYSISLFEIPTLLSHLENSQW